MLLPGIDVSLSLPSSASKSKETVSLGEDKKFFLKRLQTRVMNMWDRVLAEPSWGTAGTSFLMKSLETYHLFHIYSKNTHVSRDSYVNPQSGRACCNTSGSTCSSDARLESASVFRAPWEFMD